MSDHTHMHKPGCEGCQILGLMAENRRLKDELAALRELAHIGIELDNHHNAAVCPYCTPDSTRREPLIITRPVVLDT